MLRTKYKPILSKLKKALSLSSLRKEEKAEAVDHGSGLPDGTIVHIDHPLEIPRATLFSIQGWVASSRPVGEVRVGETIFFETVRNDVKEIHSDKKYIRGFSGILHESDIERTTISLALLIDGHVCFHRHRLKENHMLSLSKEEKFLKFSALYPDNDPEDLLRQTRELEYSEQSKDWHNIREEKLDRIAPVLQCLQCCSAVTLKEDKSEANCPSCGKGYSIEQYRVNFLTEELKNNFKIVDTANVASRAHDPLALALIGKFKGGLILDCGAGFPLRQYRNVVNYEIVGYPSTDVVGVGEKLPFADNSFDAVFSFSVLEHVKDPFRCAREIARVLKAGGVLYCSVPFLQPVHAFPHHYYSMTNQGLRNLFEDDIEIITSGIPISGHPLFTLSWIVNSWCAGLSAEHKERFLQLKMSDLMANPEYLITQSFVRDLPEESRREIACTSMILGAKRKMG